MVRSEGNMSLKNPVTPLGIDPRTVRLVAQRLNYYATPGPGCGLEGSRRFRLPDLHDIRHIKVVRSSAPRTGRFYPQEVFLVLIFTRG